ncbi:MAG: PAS domain S-box protein [Methanoregula sp.]|nr:PAS domain S-box protein [Methanoregula sp.]
MISILYVDDEHDLLEIAQLFLEETGEFRVGISTSAQEALASHSILSYDAIVADYQMPGMNGIAFLKAVRQQSGDLPFILFTGRGREEVVIDAINNGADFYLQKGGEPEAQFAELAHKIKQAVARRMAERSLRDSERRLSDIIDFLPDATFAIDKEGTVIAWNRAMEEMTGAGASEVLGRGDYVYGKAFYQESRPMLIDLVLAPDEQFEHEKYSYTLRNKTTLTAETIRERPGEAPAHFWGKARRLYDENGNLSGAIESIRDITELKKTERELRRSEAKYRDLTDLLPQMVFEMDLDLRFTYANRHALTVFGFTDQDLEHGINALSWIDPAQHAHIRDNIRKLLNGISTEPMEYTALRKDGSTIPVLIHALPIYRNKTLAGFRGVIVDISAQKKMVDELRESESKFRTLFESSPYPIAINSMPDYKFVEVNKAFLDVSGYAETEILGKNPMEMGLVSLTEAARLISRRVLEGKIENVPLALTANQGKQVHVLFTTLPVTINNKPAVVTMTVEVTKLKRVEEDLLRKNEDLNAAYEQLAAADEELRQNYDELIKREEVLRTSEEKFRALIELSLEGIFITDITGMLLFANRMAGVLVDAPDYETMIGNKNVMEFVTTESQADVLRYFNKVSQGIDPYLVHCKLITGTKREVWVECIGKKIQFQGSDAILVSMRDVTERTLAEEQMRESENKFSIVFRNSPVALTLVSATDGTFVDVNDAFLRSTGYSRHEVVGSMAVALGIFADRTEYKLFNSALRNQRAVQGMEMKCRIKTGEIRTCRFSSAVIMMGGTPHILSTVDDITERKKVEEALRESERKFRRIADNAPDMIYRMSIPDRKFEYISPASIALTGYTPEEFSADPGLVRSLIHPAWKEYFRRQWQDLLEMKVPPAYEYQIIDRAGETRWFNQRNMPVTDDRGQLVAIEGIVTDITRQKNTERELRRNELRSLAVSENLGSWIWEIDPDGMYRYSSPAVVHILGYQADELVGKMHFYDLFDPSVKEGLTTTVFATMEGREPFRNFDNLNRHKNRTPVLIRTSGSPVFDENGEFSGYCGVDEDITERTAHESAFQAMVRSMAGTTGINALRQIAENVSSWLGAGCVMIGEIQPDNQTVKVLFMLLDGKEIPGFIYTLKDTPCENVAEKGFCLYQDNVRQLFPNSKDLIDLNIRGYIGTPLRNSAGRTSGILCALSRTPITPTHSMQEIMDIIAVKAAAEIESLQMEDALRKSEQKFRSLVEYALEGIFIVDLKGKILFANNAASHTLGFGSCKELIGRNVIEFVAPESQKDVLKDFSEVARGHDAYLAQYKVITAKGKIIFVESIGKVINYEGKPADLISMRDITGRKRVEDALLESRRMLAEAMDLAHLVNWEYDVPSGLFTFDDRFYALYGTTAKREGGNLMPAEVYTREFVYPDDRHMVGEEVERTITTTDPKYTTRIEHRIIRRDGEVRHIVVRIRITKDAEGRTIKTHGANQDITDLKMAEEAVRESEEKFRSLVETTPGIIWEIDMWGRFRYISPMVKEIMGYEPDELIGGSIKDLLLEQLQPLVMQTLASLALSSNGPIQPFEVIARHRDGHDLVLEIRPSRITGPDGKLFGFRGVAFDTTGRKKAEEELKRANRQLTLLGSITRHDLLNKITVILANLKIAERKGSDAEQGEHLKKIRYATGAIKSQIEFTRVYQNLGTHEPQWIDLNTVIPYAHLPSTVTLNVAVQGLQVLSDPMLERVFFNLLDNSVRHGEHVTEIHVSSYHLDGNMVLVWEDNGIGIAADEKELIFERGVGKNTGLGLFLAREILSLTGITITEIGEPGKGARFEIVVPKGMWRMAEHDRVEESG